MKQLVFVLILLNSVLLSTAQVKIGNNPSTVNPNSLLELESNNKGLLLPRLTSAQIDAMTNAPKGMIVFNITDSALYLKRDTGWSVVPVTSRGTNNDQTWMFSGNDIINLNAGRILMNTPDGFLSKGVYGVGSGLTESGTGPKIIWHPKKAAFRAGFVVDKDWDEDSIGNYSIAIGFTPAALGTESIAIGTYSRAYGNSSFSAGYNTLAQSYGSTALGFSARAKAGQSVSIGNVTSAEGYASVAIGHGSTTVGNGSNVFGWMDSSIGRFSTAMGIHTKAKALGSFSIGLANDTSDAPDPNDPQLNDRIFQVGNGEVVINGNFYSRSNAVTVLRNGNVGIATLTPAAKLHVNNSVLFTGNAVTPAADPPANGAGERMMWYADKAAFRVGFVNSTQWDKDSIGMFSIAAGQNLKALGAAAVALGYANNSQANGSTTMGGNNTASGEWSTATGNYNIAQGIASFATGTNNITEGAWSFAAGNFNRPIGTGSGVFGVGSVAKTTGGLTIGTWNDDSDVTGGGSLPTDRVFQIGNGINGSLRSNALTVFRGGDMTIAGTLTQNSDARLKKNIRPLHNAMDAVKKLNGYYYNWNDVNRGDATQIGLLAQEVEKLFPELVKRNEKGIMSVNYIGLVPVLINAMKEQDEKINKLEKQIEWLMEKVSKQ